MGQPTRSVEGAEARQRGRARGSGGGALLVHGRHAQATRRPLGRFREHLVGDRVAGVERGLGQIWADSDLGPKTKFEARELLYIFHLETKVIRALQQRVIKPQTVSVSALITVTEIHFRKSKLGQTQCNFLHALLHNITFNFYFWTNSSCLTNFGERGMPTSLLSETPDLEYF